MTIPSAGQAQIARVPRWSDLSTGTNSSLIPPAIDAAVRRRATNPDLSTQARCTY
jgi:hypothetical protein